jgi:hypothetical protein
LLEELDKFSNHKFSPKGLINNEQTVKAMRDYIDVPISNMLSSIESFHQNDQ